MDSIEDVKNLSNADLLELYADFVRVYHYDAVGTPANIKRLRGAGVDLDALETMVLERMTFTS